MAPSRKRRNVGNLTKDNAKEGSATQGDSKKTRASQKEPLQNSKEKTSLLSAVFSGQLQLVEKLIFSGADIFQSNAEGKNVLHIAVEKEFIDIVELLLTKTRHSKCSSRLVN